MRQKRRHTLLGEVIDGKPAIVEPAAEMSRKQQQIPARQRWVALALKRPPEAINVGGEGPPEPHRCRIEHAALLRGAMPPRGQRHVYRAPDYAASPTLATVTSPSRKIALGIIRHSA